MLIYAPHKDDKNTIVMCFKRKTYTAEVFIDAEDAEKVAKLNWSVNKTRKYVIHNSNHQTIMLHRYIMDCPDDKVVNHIDGNPLNNRKANLEITTQSDNSLKAKTSTLPSAHTHKLSQLDKMDIVERYKRGENVNSIAQKYNVYYNSIKAILKVRGII